MIRISKRVYSPDILLNEGAIETQILEGNYIANPNLFTSGKGLTARQVKKMRFFDDIYGDQSVKALLIVDQHDKCCFCEGKFSDNSYGDIEHFRPKTAYKKHNARALTYPGYYWLAYAWTNLMYSCEKCNRGYKRNDFPLNNELTRKPFQSHPNLELNEYCLLINPLVEDPSHFITFNEEIPVPVAGSVKGLTSIKSYGLERLNESRLENLIAIEIALPLCNIDETNQEEVQNAAIILGIADADLIDVVVKAKTVFNSAAKDTAKFAHCVRCKFPHLPTA